MGTLFNGILDHCIRTLHLFEMMTMMAVLPAQLLPALLPQTFGSTHKPIGRRREAAVMAVFGLLSFQDFDTLLQHLDLPLQIPGLLLQPFDRLDRFLEGFA
jgi:hypothetical protein